MKKSRRTVILSCEHGGYSVPPDYRYLFKKQSNVLASHRGWDKGALVLAKELATRLNVPLFFSQTTRLLVDLNRSPHHPHLFSRYSRRDDEHRQRILRDCYYPYRKRIETRIRKHVNNIQSVIHFSIHSFTPEFDGKERNADIGLLYDPDRKNELRICVAIQSILRQVNPDLTVRRNYPYRGNADGLTTGLRKQFGRTAYAGIEVEINQKHIERDARRWSWFRKCIIDAIARYSKLDQPA